MPPVVKEWSSDYTITRFQNRFGDIHRWFFRFRIWPSRQESRCIRQSHCHRVHTAQPEMVFTTGSETHPALLVDLRGGIPARKTRFLDGL